MRFNFRCPKTVGAILGLVAVLIPLTGNATFLWGHPYAMQVNLANNGWIHMWNDLNPGSPYVGTARFPSIDGSQAHKNMWEMLVLGMVNKKLTYVWTLAGPDTNMNDGSAGDIKCAVVTIFGN